jgi:hypothetical protein
MPEQQQEKQYYSRDILDSSSTTKAVGELLFLQHNIGRRQEVQQTLLELTFAKRIDIVLVQEPSV